MAFSECDSGSAHFVLAVVHDAARYLPDLLEYMTEQHPDLKVRASRLDRQSDSEPLTMAEYSEQVKLF